MNLILRNFKN